MMDNSPVYHFDDDHLAATQQVDDRILKDVVAYVEVRTTNDNRSAAVRRELQLLGASVVKKFTNDVTHVVFKEGSNRTKTKAQKTGVHFVSVLWVDSCKQNQEHVSERMYPAIVPKQKGPNLFIAKLKKAKSMQPRDFEEEVSRSAERVNRKNRRLEALDRLQSAGNTPQGSPRTPLVLVQDTQPRSPDDGFVLTPVRLTIPDTPPSMREKMKQLKIGKEGSYLNEIGADGRKHSSKDFMYDKEPLQRKLFMSSGVNLEALSSFDSPGPNSVFASGDDTKDITGDSTQPSDNDENDTETEVECADENPLPVCYSKPAEIKPSSVQTCSNKTANGKNKTKAKDVRFSIITEDKDEESDIDSSHAAGEESDSSVTDDILDIAGKINATFNKKSSLDDSLTVDSDGFGSPGLKLDLPITKTDIQDNQNNKTAISESNETKIKKPEASKQSHSNNSILDNTDNQDANAPNKNKKKGKKSSLNINNRRKSRRISLQNVIDLIENDEKDDDASGKSESADSENKPGHSEKVTTSGGHHEIVDGIKTKKNANAKNEKSKEQDNQKDNSEKESLEKAATVENSAVHKGAPTKTASCVLTADSNKSEGSNKEYIQSELNENKTERKGRKSRIDRRRTQSDIESRAVTTKTMPKKKLLSLTDLNEQHSVLIEPSKCSEVERTELLDKKQNQKRGRRKKEDPKCDNAQSINAETDSSDSTKMSDKEHNDCVGKNIILDTGTNELKKKAYQANPKSKQADHNSESANSSRHSNIVVDNSKTSNDNVEAKSRKQKSKVNHTERVGDEMTLKLDSCPVQELNNKKSFEKENRGRKRKSKPCQNPEILGDEERNTLVADNPPVDDSAREQNRESRGRKRKSKVAKSVDNVASPKQPKKDLVTLEKQLVRVNDTILADKGPDISSNVTSQLNDITTQLNLTGNNSVTASLRDGTLSLSMSAVYNNDTTMQSILISSQRKSIDEFNLSQKNKKTATSKYLSTIKENRKVSYRSSSDSDNSISGRPRKNYRPSIVMTSLHSHEQDVVISVVKKLGGFVIAENVNETTSHVICGEPRRTLNVLQCVARGAWLLNKSWVLKSLEAGSWIPEEEFECHQSFPVCKIARLEREQSEGNYKQKLFSSVGPIYVSGRSQPPRQSLVQLIKLCGGQVTGVLNKASVYVGSDLHPGLTCLKTQWILECITQHRLLSVERFSLDRPKREASPVY